MAHGRGTALSGVDVVYIAGYGRSGSTLLDLMLGRIERWFSMGEFRQFWHARRDDWRCGCGAPVRTCAVWADVVERAQPGADQDVIDAARAAVRVRRVPQLTRGSSDPALAERIGRVYAATAAATGARVLVDSSKDPLYGLMLASAPGVRLHVVHLVRDSRAVAWSWQRTRVRPEIVDRSALMPRRAPWKTSLDWDLRNGLAHTLGSHAASYRRLTYESFVTAPDTAVAHIATSLGASGAPRDLDAMENHTVGGNPMRFAGEVAVKPDTEWREAIAVNDRRLVTALTWPLLRGYGYR